MILFYGRTWQPDNKKSLFSLEFYGAFYKGLTTNIITCPDYPICDFNRERVFTALDVQPSWIYIFIFFM